jgi:phosphohistidine swiveling domain-containing protein
MRTIQWLEDITLEDRALVGGKALNLAEARRAGFAMPDGFCITAAAYQDFVLLNGLQPAIRSLLSASSEDIVPAAARIREGIHAGQMSVQVRRSILSAYHRLTAGAGPIPAPVAVRSSASTEDLAIASFAGQQTTLLNVCDEGQFLQAVVECWASLWSPQAVLYRAQQGVSEEPMMAVLVQKMVGAESAGVAFSRDPVSGEERVVVEATWGLGEAVVCGASEVDRYTASRATCQEAGPPAVGHKREMRMLAGGGGLQSVQVPGNLRDVRVLSPGQVRQISKAVLALEQHFGCAQDVEWALAGGQLYILQSRPITQGADSFFTTVLPESDEFWTAAFLNERFPLPVSPLGWTVINELLEKLAFRDPLRYLGLADVDRLRITRLYRGHPYVSLFVFQTLYKVFPHWLLPEDAYRYFPSGDTELRHKVSYPRSLLDPRFLVSMAWHFLQRPALWSPWHNYRVWAAFTVEHDRRSHRLNAEYEALRAAGTTVQQVWAAIEDAQELNGELLAVHRWSLTCADLTYSLLRRLSRAWVKQDDALKLCTALVTALPNRSLEVDRALQHLAEQDEHTAAFADSLEGFLQQYGHRSFYLDICHPTFADEPAQVLDLLPRLRSQPARPWDEGVARRQEALHELRQAVSHGLWGWLKRRIFDHVAYLAQRYVPLREDQRFYWQRTLAQMRRLFLLLGQRMAQSGMLGEEGQIFFLTKAEVEACVQECGREDSAAYSPQPCAPRISDQGPTLESRYARLAASRQRQFIRLCQDSQTAPERAYPSFLHGNEPCLPEGDEKLVRLRGRGISPGLARGRVVTVRSPAEFSKIQHGDVLVAAGVDPGWTPIFGLLSALVLEHGGQLSHAAVVAREYGLPAVAGILGVSTSLHDGELVLVDGLDGWVTRVG